MKRAIKYYNVYNSDGAEFSCCSTKYEIIEGLYPDTAGIDDLKAIAKKLGLRTNGSVKELKNRDKIVLTEVVRLTEKQTIDKFNKKEKAPVYLGFVKLEETSLLPPKKTLNHGFSKDFLNKVVNSSSGYRLGIDEYGYHQSVKGDIIVMSDWHFYHVLPLLGYSLKKLLRSQRIKDTFFYDSVQQCSQCFEYDDETDGYRYTHKHLDSGTYCANCVPVEEMLVEVEKPEDVFIAKDVSDLDLPKEYEAVEEIFCDSSGFGSESEMALTKNGTIEKVKALLKKHGTLYAGLTGIGQFQVYVTLYSKKVKGKKAA